MSYLTGFRTRGYSESLMKFSRFDAALRDFSEMALENEALRLRLSAAEQSLAEMTAHATNINLELCGLRSRQSDQAELSLKVRWCYFEMVAKIIASGSISTIEEATHQLFDIDRLTTYTDASFINDLPSCNKIDWKETHSFTSIRYFGSN